MCRNNNSFPFFRILLVFTGTLVTCWQNCLHYDEVSICAADRNIEYYKYIEINTKCKKYSSCKTPEPAENLNNVISSLLASRPHGTENVTKLTVGNRDLWITNIPEDTFVNFSALEHLDLYVTIAENASLDKFLKPLRNLESLTVIVTPFSTWFADIFYGLTLQDFSIHAIDFNPWTIESFVVEGIINNNFSKIETMTLAVNSQHGKLISELFNWVYYSYLDLPRN